MWIRIHFCLPFFLNQYPHWSTDSCKCAREAPPTHMCTHTYMHTHTCLLMCDGLLSYLINSSHADWSIHLITGCIGSLGSHWERHTDTFGLRQASQGWMERQRGVVNCVGKRWVKTGLIDRRDSLKWLIDSVNKHSNKWGRYVWVFNDIAPALSLRCTDWQQQKKND